MNENDYFAWYPMPPNEDGLTHVVKNKKTGEAHIVHASGVKFRIKAGAALVWFDCEVDRDGYATLDPLRKSS